MWCCVLSLNFFVRHLQMSSTFVGKWKFKKFSSLNCGLKCLNDWTTILHGFFSLQTCLRFFKTIRYDQKSFFKRLRHSVKHIAHRPLNLSGRNEVPKPRVRTEKTKLIRYLLCLADQIKGEYFNWNKRYVEIQLANWPIIMHLLTERDNDRYVTKFVFSFLSLSNRSSYVLPWIMALAF